MSAPAVALPSSAERTVLHRLQEYLLPLAAISVIFIMLVPLPAAALDVLLALSMAASIIVFLSAVQIRRAVELSVFPTLLLLLTLFRLALNIASSRRILLHGSEGTSAAGKVIEAFGQFVVGGNYVVGFVLFLALIAIQFLVVSHGAVRTAEVTARFTLDALPGKQMAIDADMNAGLIDEAEARRRRQAIAREAEFYGAMDGAARFNQRDSLATILITAINIVAGLLIGTLQQGIDLGEAVRTYTILTVGDGLVTMIPSLLVSVAGGITLTRANSSGMLSGELRQQLLARPVTLYLASFVSAAMCLIPGLPKLAFLAVAACLYWAGRRVAAAHEVVSSEPGLPEKKKTDRLSPRRWQDSCLSGPTLEIGFQLIPLVDEKQGGQLLGRVRTLRRHLTAEMGFLVPPVHISDNLRLKPREYVISLRGMEIGRWQTEGEFLLAVSGDVGRRPLAGREVREPAFGVPAVWIAPPLEEQAIASGYSVVDAVTVMTTHLGDYSSPRRRTAGACRGETSHGRTKRDASETRGRAGAQTVDSRRGRAGSGAIAARAGFDPRSRYDPGGSSRSGCNKQGFSPFGRGDAPGSRTKAGAAVPGRGGAASGAYPRSGSRRGDRRGVGSGNGPKAPQHRLGCRRASHSPAPGFFEDAHR